ncbi:cell division cycle 7-related protein kinase-like [Ischnura elegans]|uniref:cell division cycle 7-related protein kinase-like n=1 Tax=Ischnura elegans TaxID=197161 RepID=UPI001ED87ACF|nr:cell division cycle 7-related protein kinase-like [Ischnura elegans]
METLNPLPLENFQIFDKKDESLAEYHSAKSDVRQELNDSVFNSPLETSVCKSTAQDASLNITVELPEKDSALRDEIEAPLSGGNAEKLPVSAVKGTTKAELEASKQKREKAQISRLLKCLPALGESFNIHRKIGEGTFSSVFMATIKGEEDLQQYYAIKHLVPTCHPSRIEKELRCLMDIGGKDNVVGVDLCLRNGLNVAFVMPYMPHNHFTEYVTKMNVDEIRLYMKNLLVALQRVHSFGIIHRDVKPSNFLYDRAGKRFLLVDFGLAHDVGESCGSTFKELSTSIFVSPRKRKRMEDQKDDENSTSQKMPCNNGLRMSPRRPLQPIAKALVQGQVKAQERNVMASPTRRPLGENQGHNIKVNHSTPSNLSKCMSTPRPSGEFCMLEPKQKSAGGLVIRVQNSKVVPTPPSAVVRNGPHRRPLFAPASRRSLASNLSPLPPPSTPPLPPVSSQLASAPGPTATPTSKGCSCHALPRVCRHCLLQKPHFAPRAGTPGFRPPEVLLKSHQQTTAVDMWAAGVILLCIASGCYPFFRSPDDITALAEIMTVFGTTRLENLATKLGRKIICSNRRPAMDLRFLCEKLRSRGENTTPREPLPNDAYDLVSRLLDLDPNSRITAEEALQHPFVMYGS